MSREYSSSKVNSLDEEDGDLIQHMSFCGNSNTMMQVSEGSHFVISKQTAPLCLSQRKGTFTKKLQMERSKMSLLVLLQDPSLFTRLQRIRQYNFEIRLSTLKNVNY